MCFGKKSSNQPMPPPTPKPTVQSNPNNVADTSNAQQKQVQAMGASTDPASFGSELGGAAPAMPATTGGM